MLQAASLAPLAPLADTLALGTASSPRQGQPAAPMIDYGSVRRTGSAAFILGSLLSRPAIRRLRVRIGIWLNTALLPLPALTPARLPQPLPAPPPPPLH